VTSDRRGDAEATGLRVAIDFGISNTDAVARAGDVLHRWTRPSRGSPDAAVVRDVLAAGGFALADVARLAVTGGRHRALPAAVDGVPLASVHEVAAIGRGGQALGAHVRAGAAGDAGDAGDVPVFDATAHDVPTLVVSAGSGTAVIAARGDACTHITGTGVGGGTLLGLGRLLLGTSDPHVIDALALAGDPNGADLSLQDVVLGPIGALPPDATAVNFGKLARPAHDAAREDLAAALVTLVGQVIAITAINAARAERLEHVVVIGHLTDLPSVRAVLDRVGEIYGMRLLLPPQGGYGTALGALRALEVG
jgi:type II pantothenate kinase